QSREERGRARSVGLDFRLHKSAQDEFSLQDIPQPHTH
nr:androgen-binding protein 2 - rat (fragments) [Rattus norvegicus]